MIVKPRVERHVTDCGVIDDETVRGPLEPEALSVLLQCFTDGRTKQAVKMEVGEPNSVCQRFKRKILIEVGLDMHKHGQQPRYFTWGSFTFLSVDTHLSCSRGIWSV